MDGKVKGLQERWKKRTDAAFQRMFADKSKAELATLTQREHMAVLIGRELAAFLLEEHVALDEAVQPSEASSACCPKCGRPGEPAVQEQEELPERAVTTRTGEIRMRRQRWRCAKCRVIFFPLDVKLRLGTEGYSPAVLSKAVRQASKAASFVDASDDLRELAEVEISPTHLQRIAERLGKEWVEVRDQDVQKFREFQLERTYKEAPRGAVAVMLDGGRVQTRAADSGRGVSEASWRESKVACCLTLPTKAVGVDPHPEPPAKFLEPTTAALEAHDLLAQLGIEVEPFGGDTVLVSGYPAMLANLGPAEIFRQMVEQLMSGGKTPDRRDVLDELLHMISCKAAIKAGDRLSADEITALVARRELCQDAHHCPHGRPTALVFTREELDRRFKRT